MKKSQWKLPFIHSNFFKKKGMSYILSNFRSSTIISKWVGQKVSIYNGAWLLTKVLDDLTIGKKIGMFSYTKKFDGQMQNKRKTKKKSKLKSK